MHWWYNLKINNVVARKIPNKEEINSIKSEITFYFLDKSALKKQVLLQEDDDRSIWAHQDSKGPVRKLGVPGPQALFTIYHSHHPIPTKHLRWVLSSHPAKSHSSAYYWDKQLE